MSAGEPLVVAVDGPSGSGKSSTARGVAQRLGLEYLDTGAMYRAMTWAMLEGGVPVDDVAAVARAAQRVELEVGTDPAMERVLADGIDVSAPIRGSHVTAAVSAVSAVPAVRELLVARQRELIAESHGIVVEGRDIASVVAPDAPVKVYLDADPDARANRRTEQLGGGSEEVASTRADLERRDALDTTTTPLQRTDGAQVIDTTNLSLDDVIEAIVTLVKDL